jgi:hypothetical protein
MCFSFSLKFILFFRTIFILGNNGLIGPLLTVSGSDFGSMAMVSITRAEKKGER